MKEENGKSTEKAPPSKTGGEDAGKKAGAIGSGLLEFFGEHKIVIIVVGGIAVVITFIIAMNSQGTNAGQANTANQQGSLAGAGYQDAGTAYALTQLTSQLDSIQKQLDNTGTGTGVTPGGKLPFFPAGIVITKGGSGRWWYENANAMNRQGQLLNDLFPGGTTFSTGANNSMYYTLPGPNQTPQLLSAGGYIANPPPNTRR